MNNNINDIAKLKYLPLGTIVLLKGAKKRLMVTGFCIYSDEQKRYFDYTGCIYPEGFISSTQNLVFDHNQIEKIIVMGYSDEEEKQFKKDLYQKLKDAINNNKQS